MKFKILLSFLAFMLVGFLVAPAGSSAQTVADIELSNLKAQVSMLVTQITNLQNQLIEEDQIQSQPQTGTQAQTSERLTLTRNLGIGSRGDDVAELQQYLQTKGFFTYPTITGYFGSITRDAVMRYQDQAGISATGFVGPLTRERIMADLTPISVVEEPVIEVPVQKEVTEEASIVITADPSDTIITPDTLTPEFISEMVEMETAASMDPVVVSTDNLSGVFEEDGWSLTWDYQIDGYNFLGETVFVNSTGELIPVEFRLDLPQVVTSGQAHLTGQVSAHLSNEAGGGIWTSKVDQPIWRLNSSQSTVQTVFDHPFALGSSGEGDLDLFTNPINNAEAVLSDTSLEIQFNLDTEVSSTAKLMTSLSINETPNADLNGDGIVDGSDLLKLLSFWGTCQTMDCPADLARDGLVGGGDLSILINAWGTDGTL